MGAALKGANRPSPFGPPRQGVPSAAMDVRWRPGVGQVVLVEVVGVEPPLCLTGVVESDDVGAGPLVIDLGASAPQMPAYPSNVMASFFNPEALYVARGVALRAPGVDRLIELDVRSMQAVQRRSSPRLHGAYPVALGAFSADDYVSVAGETIDLAVGGCRVMVTEPLPDGVTPTVCITLVDHETVVVQARVLEHRPAEHAGHWEYRLAFEDLEEPDRRRLALLVG